MSGAAFVLSKPIGNIEMAKDLRRRPKISPEVEEIFKAEAQRAGASHNDFLRQLLKERMGEESRVQNYQILNAKLDELQTAVCDLMRKAQEDRSSLALKIDSLCSRLAAQSPKRLAEHSSSDSANLPSRNLTRGAASAEFMTPGKTLWITGAAIVYFTLLYFSRN